MTVEATGFGKYVQTGITLALNQNAVVDVTLKPGGVQARSSPSWKTQRSSTRRNAEVSDAVRPAARLRTAAGDQPQRLQRRALGAPGVSQLGSGQAAFSQGVQFSSNGGRTRSNNFMIDGQDINDPSVSGGQQAINNPDIVQEVRLITNQFLAEYGRNAGSVLNIVTKAGTNDYHGTLFMFHNNNNLNACSNLNKTGGFCNKAAT